MFARGGAEVDLLAVALGLVGLGRDLPTDASVGRVQCQQLLLGSLELRAGQQTLLFQSTQPLQVHDEVRHISVGGYPPTANAAPGYFARYDEEEEEGEIYTIPTATTI